MSGWRKLDKNEHIKTLQLDTSLLHVTLFLFFVLSLARQVKKVVPAGIQKPVPGRRGLRSWWVGFGCWPHPEWPWRTGRSDCSWCTRSSLRCKRQPRDKQRGPVTNANAVQGPSMRLNFVTSNLELKQQCEVALTYQVWRLTQFFSVSFWWKINDPSSGKHYSLPFLPATPSSLSRTLEGLFELTWRPSRALDLLHALLPELQRYKDTVRCAALGPEVPGHRQQQLTQTLIVRL